MSHTKLPLTWLFAPSYWRSDPAVTAWSSHISAWHFCAALLRLTCHRSGHRCSLRSASTKEREVSHAIGRTNVIPMALQVEPFLPRCNHFPKPRSSQFGRYEGMLIAYLMWLLSNDLLVQYIYRQICCLPRLIRCCLLYRLPTPSP